MLSRLAASGNPPFAGPRPMRFGRWVRPTIFLLLAMLATAGCAATEARSSASSTEEGRRLYNAECVSCHGEAGQRLPIAPIDSAEFLNSRGDATLLAVIAEGKGVMPAFAQDRGGPYNDGQIRSLLAYLSSKAGRTSSSLLADDGKTVFQANCTRCHGEKGDRIPVAPLNAKGFLDSRTDSELLRVITEGKGLMPAWGRNKGGSLTDERIRAAVAYLRYNVDADVAQRARQGRELYVGNCLTCHGERGDRIPSVTLAASSYISAIGDGTLISVLNEGKGVMPGFGRAKGGPFGIPETAAVLAYMKSWAGLSATSALSGPEQAGEGRELFGRNCTPCHGDSGDRVQGVQLKSQAFLNNQTDRVLLQTIAQGNAKGMPAWAKANGGPFSDAQIGSILQYLKSAAAPGGSAAAPAPAAAAPAAAGAPAAAAPAAGSAGLDPALAGKGKEIFNKTCAGCHGETRDKIPTCKLADKDWLTQKTDAGIVKAITNGKPPMMPAWGKSTGGSLSDDDIKAVASYLKDAAGLSGGSAPKASGPSGAAPAAAPAAADPALASKGKQVFSQNCVMCHGETRDKVPTCKLADKDWLTQKGDDGLFNAITKGKAPMMPSWEGKIPPDDIKAIVVFLKEAAGAAGGAAASAPAASAAPAAGGADASLIATGKQVFSQNCVMCHGETRDKVPTCKLADKDWLTQKGDDGLFNAITKGKAPMMPSWEGKIKPDEIKAIVAFLKDAAGAAGGAAASAPAASAAPAAGGADPSLISRGKQVFSQNCVMCHGETRDKVPTCKLADKDWLTQKGDDGLFNAITKGKAPMMPSWEGKIPPDDIKAIVAYLKDASGASGGAAPAASAAPAAGGADASLISSGKQVFSQNCVMCHGETRDKVPTCKLADKDWLAQKGDDGLFNAITKGKAPMMPSWEGKIKPDEIKAVVAYLKSAAAGGSAPTASAAPGGGAASLGSLTAASDGGLPTPQLGKELFTKNCVMCHGEDGLRIPQCRLGSKAWIENTSDAGLRSRITNGKPGAGMPTWGKAKGGPLSDNQISAIMLYLQEGINP